MKTLLFLSNNNVCIKNGNLNCEIQRLKYLTKYFKISYISMVSSKQDVTYFLQNNSFFDVEIIDSNRVRFVRFLYRINYLLNVILCNKFKLYSNHFFIKSNILKLELKKFENIFCFYIFPAIFLNLSSSFYNSKKIFIDTNDILVDRHNLIEKRTWFSVNKKDQDDFDKKNIYFLAISDFDYKYYSKLYNNVFKLFYVDLYKFKNKQKDNLKIGYIASNSDMNKAEFMYCWENNIFHKFRDEKIEIIVFGSINSYLIKNEYILENMSFINFDDIDLFYSKIDILFCPVGPSTGIKTKVIEALISQTYVITTKFGFDGSLQVFSSKIKVLDVPFAFNDLLNSIIEFRRNRDLDLFNDLVNSYKIIIDNQFQQIPLV
jgi:hypothetical protein